MPSFRKVSTTAFRAFSLVLPYPWPAQSFAGHDDSHHHPFHSKWNHSPVSKRPFFTTLFSSATVSNNEDTNSSSPQLPLTLESLADDLATNKYQNIIVLIGAGMSVSAGIPDFRTPGTGLYSRLEEYHLPYPEAIFELQYFRDNPAPFVDVAKAIWPGQPDGPKPTLAHAFVALLEQRGLLKRVYTQNIDGLEKLAGVSQDKLIECHGHFSTASCIKFMCPRKRDAQLAHDCQESYRQGQAMQCPDCQSLVKPDIVFFGEELPAIFMDNVDRDMDDCDLLLVMGTSLLVAPVASIPSWVGPNVPRVLINRDLVGSFATEVRKAKRIEGYPIRDVFLQGDCDDGARKLCELVGEDWVQQLDDLHAAASK